MCSEFLARGTSRTQLGYVDVPQAETMGRMGQLALWILGRP